MPAPEQVLITFQYSADGEVTQQAELGPLPANLPESWLDMLREGGFIGVPSAE